MMRQWTAFAIAACMLIGVTGTSHDAYGYPIPDEGDAKLSLNPAFPCFDGGIGGTITINVDMTDLPEIAVGAQFFLEYDTSMLDFVSIDPGESPFVTEIDEEVDEGLGHIDYGVGIPIDLSLPGTSDDTTIAVITFQALQETCDMTRLISFRPLGPNGAINKLSNPIGLPIVPVLHALAGGVIDGTAPAITCPASVTVECDTDSSSAATGVATATDTCDAAPIIEESDSIAAGACPQAYVITRTWTATDACGNVASCEQIITVQDTTPPAFDQTCPLPDIDVVADAGMCEAFGATVNPVTATATDNCGTVNVTFVRSDGETGLMDAYAIADSPITITWTAEDECGNTATCMQTVTITDGEDPTIACPADQTVMPAAGECEAFVTVPAPIVDDNCDVASVVNDYNGTDDASDTYPVGDTIVTWTVTDPSGNTATCTHTISVLGTNELVVDVELDGVVDPGPFDRCITFELFNCVTTESEEINAVMTFTNGAASAVLDVPCGEYSCITARDRLHTLQRTIDPLSISGAQYVAAFTVADDKALIGGNLNDDGWIDVLDFGIYTMTYGYCIADTDCTMMPTLRHGDITGDGLVEELDFSFIQNHWLEISEPGCCTPPILGGDGSDIFAAAKADRKSLTVDSRTKKKRTGATGPITRISVIELQRRGLGELAVADLNNDGWLDYRDVQAHAEGIRP